MTPVLKWRSRGAAVVRFAAPALVLTLTACAEASLPSLTTGSLFGAKPDTQAAAAAVQKPVLRNDPLSRTLQVSRVAARAQRCGFYFDAGKLKGNFLAAEGAQPGADVASLGKLDQSYTVTFNATLKVIGAEDGYCSEARNSHIKGDLNRHLAGDYAPSAGFEAAEEASLFSFGGGLFGGEKPKE